MTNLGIITITFSMLAILSGCATQAKSTLNYTKPLERNNKNEIVVNRPFENVWSGLIRQLSKSFFVVNNVEKESRLINVSFSSEAPEDYVDCGVSKRIFENGSEKNEYVYSVAADSSYKSGGRKPQNGANLTIVDYVQRNTGLAGRINIYVAPTNDKKTEVSVNTKYVFTVKLTGQAQGINIFGQVMATSEIDIPKSSIDFTTNVPGGSDELKCFSKGVLEDEVLDMVKAI